MIEDVLKKQEEIEQTIALERARRVKVVNRDGTPYEGPEYSFAEQADFDRRCEEGVE